MIEISTNDSRICNPEQVILDLVRAFRHNHNIVISMKGEGPCARSLRLYDLLDKLCDEFEFLKENITIETCNLIEQHDEYNIIRKPQMFYLNRAKQYYNNIASNNKVFDENFKHVGHFIGHGNKYRLQLASALFTNHNTQSLQTYHCDATDEYHRVHMGIEDMLFGGCTDQEFDNACKLIKASPLSLDQIDGYPILMPETLNITKVYPNFFVELTSLTYFSGDTFYVDEKIWRPMLMKTPFMIQGPKDFITNLHKLGFKTFGNYWDEGYSQDDSNCHVPAIIENIKRLSTMSLVELKEMYQDMNSILEHNFIRLMSINDQDFKNAFTIR